MRQVSPERSGWRDRELSARHRQWGWDAPFVDFDGIEYDDGQPLFMVEYKHEDAPPVSPQASNVRALVAVADRANLPFFVVRYGREPEWWFIVRPANSVARKLRDLPQGRITERDYVTFRYRFAGKQPPAEILAQFAQPQTPARYLSQAEVGTLTEDDMRETGRIVFGINYEEA